MANGRKGTAEMNDEMSDMVHRALDQIEALNAKLANVSKERDDWKACAEKAIAGLVYYGKGTGDLGEYARNILDRIGGEK